MFKSIVTVVIVVIFVGLYGLLFCAPHKTYWVDSITLIDANKVKVAFWSNSCMVDKLVLMDGSSIAVEDRQELRTYFANNMDSILCSLDGDTSIRLEDYLYNVTFEVDEEQLMSEYLFAAYNEIGGKVSQVLVIDILEIEIASN